MLCAANGSRDFHEAMDVQPQQGSPASSESGLVGSTSDSRPRSYSVPTSQGPSPNWKKWVNLLFVCVYVQVGSDLSNSRSFHLYNLIKQLLQIFMGSKDLQEKICPSHLMYVSQLVSITLMIHGTKYTCAHMSSSIPPSVPAMLVGQTSAVCMTFVPHITLYYSLFSNWAKNIRISLHT